MMGKEWASGIRSCAMSFLIFGCSEAKLLNGGVKRGGRRIFV